MFIDSVPTAFWVLLGCGLVATAYLGVACGLRIYNWFEEKKNHAGR